MYTILLNQLKFSFLSMIFSCMLLNAQFFFLIIN